MQQHTGEPFRPGLNFIGDLTADIGLVQAATATIDALRQADIPVAYRELSLGFDRRNALPVRFHALPGGTPYGTNLLYFNAESMSQISHDDLEQALNGNYTAACWFWELSHMPSRYARELERVDEMWVASRFVRDAILTAADMPVQVMPIPIEFAMPAQSDRQAFGIPDDRYVFLFTFAATSHGERKNPFGLVEAFKRAFGHPGDRGSKGPLLVIKAHHTDHFPDFQHALRVAVESVGGILLEESLSRDQMIALLASADAYVSLHRSEGFGLGMAESMYLGKPVIGTAYSGNVDFMTPENSYLVDYRLKPITSRDHAMLGRGFRRLYELGMEWADPDIEQAAAYMKRLVDHPKEGRSRGAQAAADIRRTCSPAVVAQMVEERLRVIERQAFVHKTVHPTDLSPVPTDNLEFVERHMSALNQWDWVRLRGDHAPLGKVPIVGQVMRIVLRVILLGKLSLQQLELNTLTLQHFQYLADQEARATDAQLAAQLAAHQVTSSASSQVAKISAVAASATPTATPSETTDTTDETATDALTPESTEAILRAAASRYSPNEVTTLAELQGQERRLLEQALLAIEALQAANEEHQRRIDWLEQQLTPARPATVLVNTPHDADQ